MLENLSKIAHEAWRTRASDLAQWTWDRLVNRCDGWGVYRPESEIDTAFTRRDGSTGTLGAQKTVTGRLASALLVQHFQANERSAIMGLHSASVDNMAKWGALDIDWHGPESTAPDINLRAALHWYGEAVHLGFHPLLTESNGMGGYHL